MEDYKKKYEKALERAKDMLSYKEVRQEDIKYIFPELKEFEDEEIRKWIVRTLKSLNNSSIQIDGAYEMMLPAIAWLEKQGEQSLVNIDLDELVIQLEETIGTSPHSRETIKDFFQKAERILYKKFTE